jgi:hypothetical protein
VIFPRLALFILLSPYSFSLSSPSLTPLHSPRSFRNWYYTLLIFFMLLKTSL